MELWVIYALLSMFFAGLTAILAKAGMNNINADLATAIRTAIVAVFVVAQVTVMKKYDDLVHLTPKTFLFLVLSAVATMLSWLFYYRAMKLGNVSYVAAIDKGSILITIVLSFLLLKEPLTPKIVIGGAFILAGLLVLAWK